jgi:enamine deaminase RidA (YjgF/YER057c/UK114 family)
LISRFGGDPPSPFEGRYGFSRLAVVGGFVIVGGTTSVSPDGVVLGDTPYAQTIEILGKVSHELGRAGAGLPDVVQTRIYVVDICRSEEVGRAHGEVFGSIRPLMTMVGVAGLVDPRMLVEVETVAVAPAGGGGAGAGDGGGAGAVDGGGAGAA